MTHVPDPSEAPPISPAEWAEVWLRHSFHHRDEDFWAWRRLEDLAGASPEEAWPVVLALVARAPDERLELIGAGPLETIVERHTSRFVNRVEAAAKSDPRFRKALGAVWLNRWGLDPSAVDRLVAASGGVIAVECFDPDSPVEIE